MPWLVRLRRAVSSLQKTHCSQDRANGVSLAALTASTLHFMTRMLGLGLEVRWLVREAVDRHEL